MNETEVRTRHFSRLEYERLVDGGTLRPDERFELIGGHLIARAPQRDTHATSADLAAAALQKAFGFGYRVRVQLPLALDDRSEEHTSELQSRSDLVCRLLLEKKKTNTNTLKSTRQKKDKKTTQ